MSFNKTERALLLAVRKYLVLDEASGGGGFLDSECDVELDSELPAMVAHRYVAISPATMSRGMAHKTSGGVHDMVISVKIDVIMRRSVVPRDRQRHVFLALSDSLNELVDRVYNAVDFNYNLMGEANAILLSETESSEGFHHPLVWLDTSPPRAVAADVFAAQGGPRAGLKRTMIFGDARRTATR